MQFEDHWVSPSLRILFIPLSSYSAQKLWVWSTGPSFSPRLLGNQCEVGEESKARKDTEMALSLWAHGWIVAELALRHSSCLQVEQHGSDAKEKTRVPMWFLKKPLWQETWLSPLCVGCHAQEWHSPLQSIGHLSSLGGRRLDRWQQHLPQCGGWCRHPEKVQPAHTGTSLCLHALFRVALASHKSFPRIFT